MPDEKASDDNHINKNFDEFLTILKAWRAVFAHQKERMNLGLRSVGIMCAEATIIITNIAWNLRRWRYWWGQTLSDVAP